MSSKDMETKDFDEKLVFEASHHLDENTACTIEMMEETVQPGGANLAEHGRIINSMDELGPSETNEYRMMRRPPCSPR